MEPVQVVVVDFKRFVEEMHGKVVLLLDLHLVRVEELHHRCKVAGLIFLLPRGHLVPCGESLRLQSLLLRLVFNFFKAVLVRVRTRRIR